MHATLKQYEEDAQKAADDVAAQARAREAELRASLQFGAFDPLRHGAQAPADPASKQQLAGPRRCRGSQARSRKLEGRR